MSNVEKSFIMIKSDGVKRGLMGEIIGRIERKGYKIARAKLFTPAKQVVEEHYKEHKDKPFFGELVDYILEGPVMAMEVQGENVVEGMRNLIGNTNPNKAVPGSIRGDFALSVANNVVHGSDSPESAERELALWFE